MRAKRATAALLMVVGLITVDLAVLDPAGALDLTLGSTSQGPLTDSYDSGHMNGSRFTTGGEGGTVTSMSVFVGNVGAAPNNSYQMAVYADAGGSPGALIAQTATGSLVANSLNTLPIGATFAPNTAYWLMYNASGSDPNLNNMKYATGGTGGWSTSNAFGTWPATFPSASLATITFSIYATFSTGPVAPPTVALTAPANGATISGTTNPVTATATNSVGVQFKIDGANLGAEDTAAPYSVNFDSTTVANGTHSLTAVARNSAGATVTSTAVSVTVQNTPATPTVTITSPANGSTVSGSQTVAATTTNTVGVQFKVDGANLGAEDTVAPFSVTWDTNTVANGSRVVTADARSAGGTIVTSSVTVTVNNVVVPPGNANLGNTTAGPLTDSWDFQRMHGSRFTTGAAGGPVSSMSVFVGAVGAAPNNAFQMAIYADSNGVPGALIAQTTSGTLTANSINTLPITATVAANTAYWLVYNTNGSDPSVNNMKYSTGGTGTWTNAAVTFGTWPATFGGAVAATLSYSIYATFSTGPVAPPTVSLTAPANGATVTGTATPVTATATNAAGVQFKLGANTLGAEDTVAPYSVDWNTTTVANGTYSLTAVARNSAGVTVTSTAVSVTVQNTPATPTVTITSPANGATVSGSQTLAATTTNTVGVQFKVDGFPVGAEDTAAPFSASWDTTAVANGQRTISADARSASGTIVTTSISVTVDNGVVPPSGTQPILVITSPSNPFTTYLTEILTAEGLKSYVTRDLSTVDATTLSGYDVAVLGDMPISAAQTTMFTNWVNSGGSLIAMRPDKKLAPLLGLSDVGSTMNDTYLKINTVSGPGSGLVSQTIQWHGTADRYTLSGASAVATLYNNATSATANPAVSTRNVGANGGKAIAFTFDLARSIVLTRQGNPAWAGRNVDGVDGYQATEMFFGANGAPDWNNLDQAIIPIADEQQRLLANLITDAVATRKPLPRFWYFPRDEKAVIVMTGDDHATGGTKPRFDDYLSKSPAGCNVANWECLRMSSYLFPFYNPLFPQISNAQAVAYQNQGFEIGVHITTNCSPWGSTQDLYDTYTFQMGAFASFLPGLSSPSSTRTHCVEWDDWATHAKVKEANNIRYDTDYYYYPATWTQGRVGYFNGTAIPMRYADLDGSIIDVYQGTTQVSDESGHNVAAAVTTMLDKALGADGYYTVITANEHTDSTCSPCVAESNAIVAQAQARSVPVVSGRQMLEWLDARNASSFSSMNWSGTALSFNVNGGANGLTGMLPVSSGAGSLTAISRGPSNVPFTISVIKGVQYAMFSAATGSYTATYGGGGGGDTVPPTVVSTTPTNGASGVAVNAPVRFAFSEDLNPSSVSALSAELRNGGGTLIPSTVIYDNGTRSVVVTPNSALAASTGYAATMKANGASDLAGNPLAADRIVLFTTASGTPPPGGVVGYNTIGASTDICDSNFLNGSRVVTGASASSVSTMFVYVRGSVAAAPNNKFALAIYTDANGAPGALVASSTEGTLVPNSWNSRPISATLAANTAYWLIYNTNGAACADNSMAYDNGTSGVGAWSSSGVAYGNWPAVFGGSTLWSARFSLYAQ